MNKDLSIYIHIPFCKTICLYCNFVTFAHKNKWIPEYVDAVIREIQMRAPQYQDRLIKTIYFGGGTPSLIEPLLIKKIVQQIKAHFKVKPRTEISIECNPESVDPARLRIYKSAGITRFSLGVQSLNAQTLKRIARPHDSKTIFRALEYFKKARVRNFGVDLIMGLPGQTLSTFKNEIETLLSYQPAHLSAYFLSYDTKKIDIFIKECPQEDEQIQMYEWLCRQLRKAGFTHYEVSNWARRGYECEHNKRYWQQKEYLGIGLAAHSIIDGNMWENQKDFDAYLKNPAIIQEETKIDDDLRRMEYIMLSLRTNRGINLKKYEKFSGANISTILTTASSFIASGHLKKIGRGDTASLIATEKGFLILDKITRDLI